MPKTNGRISSITSQPQALFAFTVASPNPDPPPAEIERTFICDFDWVENAVFPNVGKSCEILCDEAGLIISVKVTG